MAKYPNSERREAVCQWLAANGIDPKTVPIDADMTISEGTAGRFLSCEVFDLTPDGHRQVDEHGDKAAVTAVSVPLKVEPPTWWQPYQKPTRDDLLAATDRVRALHVRNQHSGSCEHCSTHDYPDYDVQHPCPTIQALDGNNGWIPS